MEEIRNEFDVGFSSPKSKKVVKDNIKVKREINYGKILGGLILVLVLCLGTLAFLIQENHFKSEINQEVNLEPITNNQFDFNPTTQNAYDFVINVIIDEELLNITQ